VQLHSFSIIFHFYKEWSVFQQLLYLQSTTTTLATQPFPSGYASINYDAKHILFDTNIYNFTQQNQSSPFNYLQLTINFTTYCSQKKLSSQYQESLTKTYRLVGLEKITQDC